MYLSNSNKTKTYYLYYLNPETNRITSRSCKTKIKSEALKFLNAFRSEIRVKPTIRKNQRLSGVRTELFTNIALNNSKNTFRSYLSSFENLIRIIGDKYISEVNKFDLEYFKSIRMKEVNSVSVNLDLRNIKALFNKLTEFGSIEISKISNVKFLKIEKKKNLSIDSNEIISILNECDNLQLKQIIRFTLLTANRISETLSIKIKDIDFENELINVYQRKTNCFKTIPMSENLFKLLNEILNPESEKVFSIRNSESYLFYNTIKNNSFIKLREDYISKLFKKLTRKLKLNEDYKFHCLRHTAISELIKNNIPIAVVKEIAGHSSINTTMLYTHITSNDLKQATKVLNY